MPTRPPRCKGDDDGQEPGGLSGLEENQSVSDLDNPGGRRAGFSFGGMDRGELEGEPQGTGISANLFLYLVSSTGFSMERRTEKRKTFISSFPWII